MVNHGDYATRIAEDLSQVIASDYYNHYEIVNINPKDDIRTKLQGRILLSVILDSTPEINGVTIASTFKEMFPYTDIILLTRTPIELGGAKDLIDTHIPGELNLDKISQAIRNTLNNYVERMLQISLGESSEKVDIASSIIKGAIGLLPVGSLIAEVLGSYIPNQRMARFDRFLRILAAKLVIIEEEVLRQKMKQPQFLDLFEDAAYQSVKSANEQRLEYIANLLKNSLTDEEVEIINYKIILSLLGEINDIEIILLQYHGLNVNPAQREEFYKSHLEVLKAPIAVMGSPQPIIDRSTVYKTHRTHLVRLGLLKITFKKPKKGEIPEFDEKTGMIEAKGHEITPLGRLLLRYIDQSEPLLENPPGGEQQV
jgi:hypothetical protein